MGKIVGKGDAMNDKCLICEKTFWKDTCEPLSGEDRYCQACAIVACETVEDLNAHTTTGETKDFTYPRWIWEKMNKLFANTVITETSKQRGLS